MGVPAAVAGLLAVGFAGLATRGMHLDGLADTADGLGCYGPPERALAVMRDGGAGPFAVVTLLVVVGAQAAALAALATPRPPATQRAAAGSRSSRRPRSRGRRAGGVPVGRAARGARGPARRARRDRGRVAAVVGRRRLVGGAGGRGLRARRARAGVLAVGLGAAVVAALSWHTARRFGGMTGDVLGAASELATPAALVVLAAR